MIDAYEIGIQLALQDGVSAGLEVIGRELAEVDRAIAASNAGLIALSQTAQSAVRAAAAAAGSLTPAAGQPARERLPQDATSSGPQVGAVPQVVDSAPAAPTTEPARMDGGGGPRAERGDAVAESARGAQLTPPPAAESMHALAPNRDRGGGADVAQQSAAPIADAVPATPGVQQIVNVASAADTQVRGSGLAPAGAFAPGAPARPKVASPPAAPSRPNAVAASAPARQTAPMLASVAQAIAPQTRRETVVQNTGAKGGSASLSMPVNVATSQAPVTTGGGASTGMLASARGAGSSGRGAAPEPEARERGEGGGGSVMLDGRLVGYWLTEQMARDAARPPGGTSFFDPRQSPAWTPSGAL